MNYEIKQFSGKKFTDKMDMIRFMKNNFKELLYLKKSEYKTDVNPMISGLKTKSFTPEINVKSDIIEVEAVINTTNIIDSHMDLHLESTWNKTVNDNPHTYHLQEHVNSFSHVLSSKASQRNEVMNFNKLGLDVDFQTVANINRFVLSRDKNKLMFDSYAKGEVSQHSVGMRYVNLSIAYHDEDDQKEMDYFNEMKAKAVNPEVADRYGYFWVISEAMKREGSAVLFGSNSVTPTLYVKDFEPSKDTRKKEPSEDTRKNKSKLVSTNFNF